MPLDPAEDLARATRAYLIAAAGYGKTETVAKAAGLYSEGRQLVLTHTHAGVKALKDRLKSVGADGQSVRVDTIAGFALRYAASFPRLSGIPTVEPANTEEWTTVYEAGRRILETRTGRQVLTRSYSGLFVDEYQDCVLPQHELIATIAEEVPCRVVLDPLQGIFGFGGQELISPEIHLDSTFERLPDLQTPYRWRESNPELGEWLGELRSRIQNGSPIDLRSAPLERRDMSYANQTGQCFDLARRDGSAVAIGRWPSDCHTIASRLRGVFTVMEPIECPDLMTWTERLDRATGVDRSIALLELAAACMTQVRTQLRSTAAAFSDGRTPTIRDNTRNRSAVEALIAVTAEPAFRPVLTAMREIESIPQVRLYRRELWRDVGRAIQVHETEEHQTLPAAAWHVRDRGRHAGRRVEHRTVSRTVLVKGLEFDHALVLDADQHDGRNLYVAMTRGSASLTVLSQSPVVRPLPS